MSYELVLKNEVAVEEDVLKAIFAKGPVYVAGYGSLLYSRGWKNRGMSKVVTKADLTECIVSGYKRGPFGLFRPMLRKKGFDFYGVVEDKNSYINAVLVKIPDLYSWLHLMGTEQIKGLTYKYYNYRVVDITKNVRKVKLETNATVHMVANEAENLNKLHTCDPYPYYYYEVAKGVSEERSAKFIREFNATGAVDLTDKRYAE